MQVPLRRTVPMAIRSQRFSPRIAGLSGNDKQVIFNVRTSSSVAYYNDKMIIATADTNASMGSIHIVDTVNYSNVYPRVHGRFRQCTDNASRVVFMVVPEFVSGLHVCVRLRLLR